MTHNRKETGVDVKGNSWLLLLVISTAYIAVTINIQGFMGLLPFVQAEFMLTRAQAGLYTTFYFLSATLVATFSGRVVDLIGSKRGMILGVSCLGVLFLLHAVAPFFNLILLLAFFTGLGFSLITPSANKAVMESVAPEKRAVSMGIMQSGLGVGGFLGASLLPLAGGLWGWRVGIALSGITALVMGLIIYRYFDDSSTLETDENEERGGNNESFLRVVGIVFGNRYLLCVCIIGFFFGLVFSSVTAHFALFMNTDLGFSRAFSGFGLGLLQIGGIIGRPLWGLMDDRLLGGHRMKGLFLLGLLIAVLLVIFGLLIHLQLPWPMILILAFLLGATSLGTSGLHLTGVAELSPREYTGIATGVALFFTRAGVVISPPLFGYLADMTSNYTLSWYFLGGITLVSSLFIYYISQRIYQGKAKRADI